MKKEKIDGILIIGPGEHNPAMNYFTGKAFLTKADLIQKQGKDPVLFHSPMERESARKTGFNTKSYTEFPSKELRKEVGNENHL
ncbi:MAG: hypothetical protein JEZ06_17725 [Anaerolineaceae bacterium]|nr:hypothetical protein [Anaerolineaceae bacterium]